MIVDDHRLAGATWRKASRSTTNGDCIEIAHATGVFGVRDSKNPDGGLLILPRSRWASFLGKTRANGFR